MLDKKMVAYHTLGVRIYEGNRIFNHTTNKSKCHVELPRLLSASNTKVYTDFTAEWWEGMKV